MLLSALLFSVAGASAAQAVPRDSTAPRSAADSAADTTKVKKDTIEARFAQAEMPVLLEVGETYTWDRAALFNTGALTLIDVLDRVPGLTVFRSGWFPSPQYASYFGNPARVRIFVDGAELIPIGNSTSYPLDLASVLIWSVQEMSLERGADEVRIYIHSWNVTRTATQSRVDIVTGDLGTNILRGYFGSRFQNGIGVQFGGQVYGTSSDVTTGGGTGSDLLARVGWARGRWSIDAFWERSNGTRDPQIASTIPAFYQGLSSGIPGQNGYRTNSYVRAGVGQPDSGSWWAQAMLSEQVVSQRSLGSLAIAYFPSDSLRVTQSATQLIAAAGLNAGLFHLNASGRHRQLPAGGSNEITARASLATRFASLSAFADYVADSAGITDIQLKITPTSFLAAEGAVGYRSAPASQGGDGISGRLAVGARLGRVWISVGEMQRDATVVPGLVGYDTLYVSAASAAATGPFVSIRGKVIEDLGVDISAIRWSAPGFYRPQLQSRAELFLDTEWRKQFPSGHFGFHGAAGLQYRSDVLFPTAGAVESLASPTPFAVNSSVAYVNLEVRVVDATLYFLGNWAITPRPYELVPQYVQEAQLFTYGLRWNFWN